MVGIKCNALTDMEALCSCMCETIYKQLMPPSVQQIFYISVTSASGNTHSPLRTVTYPFKLRKHSFKFDFIIFKNLTGSLILGLDFMQKHKIHLKWADTEKGLLTHDKNMLVHIINVSEMGSYILACSNLMLPPRTLAMLNAQVELRGNPQEQIYEVKSSSLLSDKCPNMVVILGNV